MVSLQSLAATFQFFVLAVGMQVGNRLLSIWAGDRTEYTLGVTIRTVVPVCGVTRLRRLCPCSRRMWLPLRGVDGLVACNSVPWH